MMTRRTFLTATLALFTLPRLLLGQAEKQAVEQAERGWAEAVVAGDLAALEKTLADDLIYTHSNGLTDNKTDYIGKLRSAQTRYLSVDYDSMDVRVYGNAAVVHSKARIKAQTTTAAIDSNLVMLHVWLKSGETWKLAAHQTTKLP
ncbi:MAG: nuclear transport factor 2 family protein [Acidobacteriota bacterium]